MELLTGFEPVTSSLLAVVFLIPALRLVWNGHLQPAAFEQRVDVARHHVGYGRDAELSRKLIPALWRFAKVYQAFAYIVRVRLAILGFTHIFIVKGNAEYAA